MFYASRPMNTGARSFLIDSGVRSRDLPGNPRHCPQDATTQQRQQEATE
jgi:hypothetical protein